MRSLGTSSDKIFPPEYENLGLFMSGILISTLSFVGIILLSLYTSELENIKSFFTLCSSHNLHMFNIPKEETSNTFTGKS